MKKLNVLTGKIYTDNSTLDIKVMRNIEQKRYEEKVSKQAVLHHLKQLKAQMGKAKNKAHSENDTKRAWAIEDCMDMIDGKIKKVNNQP